MTTTVTTDDLVLLREWRRRQAGEAVRPWFGGLARPNQCPPPDEDWFIWLILAGRGYGKTRTGAEYTHGLMQRGACAGRFALVAETAADARDVMIEGESGLVAVAGRYGVRLLYEPSKRRVTWPNGAMATAYSGDDPEQLRGPQHGGGWVDEPAKFRRLRDTWDNLMLGLRLGSAPRVVATTTPRPLPLIRELIASPLTRVTRGTTYENLENLAPTFRASVVARLEGTRIGRQELDAELLEDTPGALWTLAQLDALRVTQHPALTRVVVGVDPKSGDTGEGGETGIIVNALGVDGHGYTLADRTSDGGPGIWAPAVIKAALDFHAGAVVVEKNQGGAMVAHTLRLTPGGERLRIIEVWASRGKVARAEPVAALYERGMWHHVGAFAQLETQMTTYVPGSASPDRLDAHVWAATELFPGLTTYGADLVGFV